MSVQAFMQCIATVGVELGVNCQRQLRLQLEASSALESDQCCYVLQILCEYCYQQLLPQDQKLLALRQQLWSTPANVPTLPFLLVNTAVLPRLNELMLAQAAVIDIQKFLLQAYADYQLALQPQRIQALYAGFEQPAVDVEEFLINTKNNQGYMTTQLDPISRQFVALAAELAPQGLVLEIGTAYGIATLAALAQGAKVYANDLDAEHLAILTKHHAGLPGHLTTIVGRFPDELNFPPASFDAILICRVLHFFAGAELVAALQQAREWLKVGGKLFVVAETPYLASWSKFLPEYLARKQRGEQWPGVIRDLERYEQRYSQQMPPLMHFLDAEVLQMAMLEAGFTATELELSYINRQGMFPKRLLIPTMGKESVACIAIRSA